MRGLARNPSSTAWRREDLWLAAGLTIVTLGIYLLTGPGRIDMIDGQVRFEVARSLVTHGDTILRDRMLGGMAVVKPDGVGYAWYGAAASVAAVPAVALGLAVGDPRGELAMVLFSTMSAFFGAGLLLFLYVALRRMGAPPRSALGWCAVVAFTTLVWPTSASTFDQTQHAFFLFSATWLAYESANRRSTWWALAAGACGGVLVNFNEAYSILLPAVALATLTPGQPFSRDGRARYAAFGAASLLGLAVWIAYNIVRLGGIGSGKPVDLQSPLAGFLSLTISPGKSFFLFSPPMLLAWLGWRGFRRSAPTLAGAVLWTTVIHVAFISSVSYFGSDWCWGPRYLVPLIPLWALALPFVEIKPVVKHAFVATGLVVQLLGLSMDHQRFFYEHRLLDHFWLDRWSYFKYSQLFSRPFELRSLFEPPPREVVTFLPVPYPGSLTYAIFGNPLRQRHLAPLWMRQFLVFYLPRPWPLWMALVDKTRAPLDVDAAVRVLVALTGAGCVCLLVGLRKTMDVARTRADEHKREDT